MKKVFLALCAFTISLSACKQIESPVESDEDVAIESSQVKEYDVQGLNVTLVENEIVINSRMEWEILIKKSSQQTHDTIDFTKYTLVGYKVKVSGCEDPVVKKKVFKNKNKKHYKVRYQVMRRGDCDKQIERVYWLLIPKTEAGFKIIFVREDDEDDCHHDKDSADSNHTQMNLLARFWASDSSYGREKFLFTTTDSVFLNYELINNSTKNLLWKSSKDSTSLVRFFVFKGLDTFDLSSAIHTAANVSDTLKASDTLRFTWKAGAAQGKVFSSGNYTAIARIQKMLMTTFLADQRLTFIVQ